MSISDDKPEEETTPHQFAVHELATHKVADHEEGGNEFVTHEFAAQQFASIERSEQPFQPSLASKAWGKSGLIMATVLFIAILIVGTTAERTLNHLAPDKQGPTAGMVVEQAANTPTPTPAYPTVYVQQSADPSQAPSPLPAAPVKTK
jgi:hypothetical protein